VPAAARRGPDPRLVWVGAGLALLAVAGLIAVLTEARPSYDAMGWMVWGRQVLHWNLNTDGAPSWKPLTFLFTLPYALTGHRIQLSLWTLTAVASAVAAVVLAGRIAYRLTPAVPQRRWARAVAAFAAAVGVATIGGYVKLVLIANSDPLILALVLAAIDLHLSARHRATFAVLWLAGLGRPEGWAFELLYAAWAWRAVPRLRPLLVAGIATTPVCWFGVPALTSKSWLTPGDLALGHSTAIHGNKLIGVFNRTRGNTGAPMQVAWGLAILLALRRRDRAMLGLAGLAALWMLVEVAFAIHGWSAVARYLIEPAAVLIVVAGVAVGSLVADPLPLGRLRGGVGPLLAAVLVAAMVPWVSDGARTDRDLIDQARLDATAIDRLGAVVAADGGARAIRTCGQPVSLLGFQSTLAWELDMNVGNVGYRPGAAIDSGAPIVFFKPHRHGWIVRATHPRPALAARCALLDRATAFS
jgi:hypothetical protein